MPFPYLPCAVCSASDMAGGASEFDLICPCIPAQGIISTLSLSNHSENNSACPCGSVLLPDLSGAPVILTHRTLCFTFPAIQEKTVSIPGHTHAVLTNKGNWKMTAEEYAIGLSFLALTLIMTFGIGAAVFWRPKKKTVKAETSQMETVPPASVPAAKTV